MSNGDVEAYEGVFIGKDLFDGKNLFTVPCSRVSDTKTVGRRTKILYQNPQISKEVFKNASDHFLPGEDYCIEFHPILDEIPTEYCFDFMKEKQFLQVGAKGMMELFKHHPEIFPKDKWVISLDREENLITCEDGSHGVVAIRNRRQGAEINLGSFEEDWNQSHILLCVSKIHWIP